MTTPDPHYGLPRRALIDAAAVGLILLAVLTVRIEKPVEASASAGPEPVRAASMPFVQPASAAVEPAAAPPHDATETKPAKLLFVAPRIDAEIESEDGAETGRIEIRTQEWFRDLDQRLHLLQESLPAVEFPLKADRRIVRTIEKVTLAAGEKVCEERTKVRCS